MAIQGLPSGTRARVYERIVDQLVTDSVLKTVVKKWTTGLGKYASKISPNAATATHVCLAPRLGPVEWYSPDSQLGNLQIMIDILVPGEAVGAGDMLDVINVWEAIENAFYPIPERRADPVAEAAAQAKQWAIQQALRDCGSHTGQITFSQPASFAGTEKSDAVAHGMMQVDVIRAFNP